MPPARGLRLLSRLADGLIVLAILAGAFLLFHRLSWNGTTWDELVDYGIARDFVHHGTLISNPKDPTQSRLPHLLGAAFLAVLGNQTWVFKLPFALVGLLGGVLLYRFLSPRLGQRPALYALAFYATSPWMLASSRTAATAGDVLVVVTTFGFFWATVRLAETRLAPEHDIGLTMLYGAVAGIAVGAKMTNLVLLPAGFLVVTATRRSLPHAAAFIAFAVVAAIATNPPFLKGPSYFAGPMQKALGTAVRPPSPATAPVPGSRELALAKLRPDGDSPIEVVELISLEETPKWNYLWAVLVGKLTLPFVVVVLLGIAVGVGDAVRSRRFDAAFWIALGFVLATCGFAFKVKQNVNYYLPLFVPALTIAAFALARLLRSTRAEVRAAGALLWLGVVSHQLWLSAELHPDLLQAGRRLGPSVQGTMAGPAVNHCQGAPLLIERLNRLRNVENFEAVFVLETCFPLISQDARLGPIAPAGYEFRRYDRSHRPRGPHLIVVHESIRYYGTKAEYRRHRVHLLRRATRGCVALDDAPRDRFTIFRCPDARGESLAAEPSPAAPPRQRSIP